MAKKKDKVIYQLIVKDIQEVASQELDRKLSPEELEVVEDLVGKYIPWYDSISLAIHEMISQSDGKARS